MITAEVIKNLSSTDLTYQKGDLQQVAIKVLPPEICDAESLVFVSKPEQLQQALDKKAPILVAHKNLTLPESAAGAFFSTPSIQLAMAAILPLFDGKMNRFNQEVKIHPQAFIHPSAHIGKNVTIAPFVYIGEEARIGDGCTIGAGSVVESYAVIGDHTLLHPQVFVGAYCEIGAHCEIHPHTTIGADGFSYGMNAQGEHKKIPQLGKVEIKDQVEIGANCAIDRAAFTVTRIGRGTKIDNLSHVAHNVTIGENCVMAAGFKIAGSSHIGNNFMCGGDVSVRDHVSIADRVILAGRTGVSFNIPEPGQYGGYPVEPFRDHLRTLGNLQYIGKIKKQVYRILKHLNLDEENS